MLLLCDRHQSRANRIGMTLGEKMHHTRRMREAFMLDDMTCETPSPRVPCQQLQQAVPDPQRDPAKPTPGYRSRFTVSREVGGMPAARLEFQLILRPLTPDTTPDSVQLASRTGFLPFRPLRQVLRTLPSLSLGRMSLEKFATTAGPNAATERVRISGMSLSP